MPHSPLSATHSQPEQQATASALSSAPHDATGAPPDREAASPDSPANGLLKDLDICLPLFPVMAGQLEEVSRQIEESVVAVCTRFQAMSQKAREAVSGSALLGSGNKDAHAAADGGMDGLVSGTRDTLGTLLQRIEQSSRFSSMTAERIKRVEEKIESVEEMLRAIDDVAASARLLALNGQIEAARAGAHGVTFSIVARETATMAQHAAASSKTMRQLIEAAAGSIDVASTELQERASSDSREVVSSHAEVNRMLDSITALNEQMQQAIVESKANAESLAHDISQAVMTLQFQDTVGQRIAHVVQSLNEMHASFQSHLDGAAAPQAENGHSLRAGRDWKETMSKLYTMESERKVLAQSLDGGASQGASNDDNVELF